MEKILSCTEEIKKIHSATRGIVADEQIEALFVQIDLDEQQKAAVFGMLEADGIAHSPRAQHFCKAHEVCQREMSEKTNLAEQYANEMPILTQSIASQSATGITALVHAVMAVSSHRANANKKDGWICGTPIPQKRVRFAFWVQTVFSENEIDALVTCLKAEQTLTPAQTDMVHILLHNAPVIIVHPLISRFFRTDT